MNNYTNDTVFTKFNYYIISTFAEYLNDVEQASFEDLNTAWWHMNFRECIRLIFDIDEDISVISSSLIHNVLCALSNITLSKKTIRDLNKKLINNLYSFISEIKSICYCNDRRCKWDCGYQECGKCIDCCRCYQEY